MFYQSIIFITKAIKVFGVTSVMYDLYASLFGAMGINFTLLIYTLAIETLFVYLKSTHYEIPIWLEAMEDFI
jgi:hypothetical protein